MTRLAWLLADLPVTLVARVRSDRVFYRPAPARVPGVRGRTGRHGEPVRCEDPATWDSPDLAGQAESARHGPLAVTAWARVHQMIHRGCGGWEDWPSREEYPVIGGTDPAGRHPARPRLRRAGADVAMGQRPGRRPG